MFYMFDVFGIQDSLYIDILWDEDKIMMLVSHESIKQYEEIVYNTFLPYYEYYLYLILCSEKERIY